MNEQSQNIPAEAADLASRGQIIDAIKVTRERTGLSLKEAKDLVDAYVRNPHGPGVGGPAQSARATDTLPDRALFSLQQGRLIDAIKHTREATGLGLKDSKETVERYLDRHSDLQAQYRMASAAEFKRVAVNVVSVVVLLLVAVLAFLYLTDRGP